MDETQKQRSLWLARNVLPHEPMLRTWLRHKILGELEIDDVVQETYAILAAREQVDDIRNPRNYAFQIAFSIIQTHLRRRRIVSFRSLADLDTFSLDSDEPSPEREVADRDELRLVGDFISNLPARCRDVILLRRVHNLSYREIAQRLNISENAVEKLVSKGLRLLMEAFGRGGGDTSQSSRGGAEGEFGKVSEK